MKWIKNGVLALVLSAGGAGAASAAVTLQFQSVSSSGGADVVGPLDKLINQAGLSAQYVYGLMFGYLSAIRSTLSHTDKSEL